MYRCKQGKQRDHGVEVGKMVTNHLKTAVIAPDNFELGGYRIR